MPPVEENVLAPTDNNWGATKVAEPAKPMGTSLMGLSFAFTGELSSLTRTEVVNLVKQFGGRVSLPSRKTDYIVLGKDVGPAKLAAIKKHCLRTINEVEFLTLISTGKGVAEVGQDEKIKNTLEKEQEAICRAIEELKIQERTPLTLT